LHRIEANGNGDRQFRTLLTLGAVGQWDDAELLARFVAGSGGPDDAAELAFAALVDRHGATVLRVARTVLGDEATALDAFQATFLILAQKARNLRVDHSLTSWLAAVARRVALGARKARARRHRLEQAAARPEAVPASAPNHDVWGETLRAVLAEVNRLPEPYRAAVVACHLDGLTQREAADRLNWPVGTLQSRLDRGRRKLRDRLTRQGLAPSALGLLPPSGLSVSLPPGLATTLARAATCWAIRSTNSSLIAPSVLAILQPAQKGLIMANLKVSSLVLGAAIVAAGSGWTLGVGPSAQPGDNSAQSSTPTRQPPSARSTSSTGKIAAQVKDIDLNGYRPPAPADLIMAAGRVQAPSAVPMPTEDSPRPEAAEPAATPPRQANFPVPTRENADSIPPPAQGPGLPTLLCFADFASEKVHSIAPMVITLIDHGYPVRYTRIEQFRDLVERFEVRQVPCFLLIDLTGKEVARTSEPRTVRQLADFYNQHRPKVAALKPGADEPALLIPPARPRPWETTVRVKISHSTKEWSFGSGTVVSSTPAESLVLTCAHHFRPAWDDEQANSRPKPPITIDLFGGELIQANKTGPAQLPCTERDWPTELVALNFGQDVAILRFQPKKTLPAARIVPQSWVPETGMKLISTGCSHGNDVTAWSTVVLDPSYLLFRPGEENMLMTKCQYQLTGGRSGGGLFTPEGDLVGLAAFAEPNEKAGLYVRPQVIRAMLKAVSQKSIQIELSADDLEDRRPAAGSSPEAQVVPPPSPVIVAPAEAPREVAVELEASVPTTEHLPAPPQQAMGEQDRRLNELERKIDRILEHLEKSPSEPGPHRRSKASRPELDRADDAEPASSPVNAEEPPPARRSRPVPSHRPAAGQTTRLDSHITPVDPGSEPAQASDAPAPAPRPARPSRGGSPPPRSSQPAPEPDPAPAVSDQERRLSDPERKLDRVLESLDNIRGGLRSEEVAPRPVPQ